MCLAWFAIPPIIKISGVVLAVVGGCWLVSKPRDVERVEVYKGNGAHGSNDVFVSAYRRQNRGGWIHYKADGSYARTVPDSHECIPEAPIR